MGILRFNPEDAIRKAEADIAKMRGRKPLTVGFFLKGGVLSLLVAAGIVALADRFSIAIAPQKYLCLPPYRIWVIDKYSVEPVRGEIFAFKSVGLAPIFSDGTTIVKVLEGMPGDQVEVSLSDTRINDQVVGTGLEVATENGLNPEAYVRSGTIEANRYWFFGKTPDSFDSRYWGSVDRSQIIGKAYPIW